MLELNFFNFLILLKFYIRLEKRTYMLIIFIIINKNIYMYKEIAYFFINILMTASLPNVAIKKL